MKLARKAVPGLGLSHRCRLPGICRSPLYCKPVDGSAENLRLMRPIDGIWLQFPFHGAAKRTEVLRLDHGETVNHKRVERLYGINSDQGAQFTSEEWVQCLCRHNISISMDGKGRAKDNILVERLWRAVKYGQVYPNPAEDGLDLYKGLKEFFHWYNTRRRHEGIGCQRPIDRYPHIAHLSTKEKEAKRKFLHTSTP